MSVSNLQLDPSWHPCKLPTHLGMGLPEQVYREPDGMALLCPLKVEWEGGLKGPRMRQHHGAIPNTVPG